MLGFLDKTTAATILVLGAMMLFAGIFLSLGDRVFIGLLVLGAGFTIGGAMELGNYYPRTFIVLFGLPILALLVFIAVHIYLYSTGQMESPKRADLQLRTTRQD